MTTAITKPVREQERENRLNTFRSTLDRPGVQRQLQLAIRGNLDPAAVSRIVLTTLQRSPQLLGCTIESVLGSVITCLQLGLEPDSASGLAYLVPYKNTCTLIPGYRGLIQLAYRSGQVASFETHNVFANEDYTIDFGGDPPIRHRPKPPSDRGEYVGSYAKVKLNTGGTVWEWMWAEEIEAVRQRAAAGSSGPWTHKDDVNEMRRKTVARRASKYVPSSPTLQRAIGLEEQTEATGKQDIEFLDLSDGEAPENRVDNLAAKLAPQAPAEPKPKPAPPKTTPAPKPTPPAEPQTSLLPEQDDAEQLQLLRMTVNSELVKRELPDQRRLLNSYGLRDVVGLKGLDEENLNNLLGDLRDEAKAR